MDEIICRAPDPLPRKRPDPQRWQIRFGAGNDAAAARLLRDKGFPRLHDAVARSLLRHHAGLLREVAAGPAERIEL